MLRIRTVSAAVAAPFESLGSLLSIYRAIARVSVAALSFAIIIVLSSQAPPATQAGPAPDMAEFATSISLLPRSLGVDLPTGQAVSISFDAAMDRESVEQALVVSPAHPVELTWSASGDQAVIRPTHLWRTDTAYQVTVATSAVTAAGQALVDDQRYVFTTQRAPTITDFQVSLAKPVPADPQVVQPAAAATSGISPGNTQLSPSTTPKDVSASSAISISFSAEMDHADVEGRFAINPVVPGSLSWRGQDLEFRPSGRLVAGARYTVSVVGAHDAAGNLLGGKGSFSFLVQDGAQLTKTAPEADAVDVEPAVVELWFSQPMNVDATNTAFGLTDTSNGALVAGHLTWNEAHTQLLYIPDAPLAGGRTYALAFTGGAVDADGNTVEASLSFSTRALPAVAVAAAPTVRSTPDRVAVPPPGPATSLAGHALNQVNAARAAYGFAPVVLDAAISAVASSHAWDQANNGYFSHYGQNGSSRESRLAAGGVSFSWSGENQCYHFGMGEQATLDWCHAQFLAEPYPGEWNHIANILNPSARRMGVGIATVGSNTVITWNFTD